MRAAVNLTYGPPSVVQIRDVAKPTPEAGQVLVQVHVTTVNRTDSGYRGASPFLIRFFSGLTKPRRTIMGTEFAGQVVALGPGASAFNVGDDVFGYNEGPFGTHAQFLCVDGEGSVALMPTNASYTEAAPATEGAHYANNFIRAARIERGQRVLINGATGAIGSAAVQLVKSLGAEVTAVCGTEHVELVAGLGADRVIDYQTEDFTQDDQRYHVVLDAVGKTTFGRCRRLLEPRGIFIGSELGPFAQNIPLAFLTPLFRRRKVMFPVPKHSKKVVTYLKDLMESGDFKPLLDRTYPLDEIVAAYEYVETGRKVGNVVITVGHDT